MLSAQQEIDRGRRPANKEHQFTAPPPRLRRSSTKMTSRTRHCARLGIVLLGICCIASGIYLFRNWIDMFTRMRGQVGTPLDVYMYLLEAILAIGFNLSYRY